MKETIKQLSNNPYAKKISPYLILGTCSLIIWYFAPYIAIADSAPLAQPEKRFYAILLMFIGYFIKLYLVDSKKLEADASPATPELDKKLKDLAGRFEGAVKFLKRTVIVKNNRNTSLNNLPWYLLIGSQYAGKTSLLANANVNYILSKQFKKENLQSITSSEGCDWWVTRDSVLMDVPSNYLFVRKSLTGERTVNPLWTHFITLLKKFRGKKAISGVVFALSIPELMAQKNAGRDRFLTETKQRITELRAQFGDDLPVYLTLTKCDLIPGFVEFFGDTGSDELSQAWGVTIPTLKEKSHLLNAFNQRFNALIKRVNKQLIWRLHHERNPFARPYIKDFPLQMERIKENLINILKIITHNDANFNLQSVYLSSALQIPKETPIPHVQAANTSTQALQIMKNPIMPTRPYFVKQLLLQGFLYKAQATNSINKYEPKRQIAYGISAAVVVVTATFLGNDFRNSIQQTYAIRNSLAEYQASVEHASTKGPHLIKALPLLNALEQSASKPHSLFNYSDKASQSTTAAYHQALGTVVLPEIKNDLENYLTNASSKNPEMIYTALKAYMMLSNAEHIEPVFIVQTLQQINPELFNDNKKIVTNHIYAAFNKAWQPMQLNDDISIHARNLLAKLAPVELANVILKNNTDNNTLVPIDFSYEQKPDLFANIGLSNQVPKMYTATNFQHIYDQEIEAAAAEATDGSWVLGELNNNRNNPPILDQLRALYIANYIDIWESLVANIHLMTPNNLADTQSLINALIDHHSPLIQILQTVHNNISFAPILSASPKLNALNSLVSSDNNQQDVLYKSFVTLQQVSNDMQRIIRSNDISESSFNFAVGHIKNDVINNPDAINQLYAIADKTPQPLHGWLKQIANLTWHYELANAADFIKQHWKSDVMSNYHSQIENRYPLSPKSSVDISLNQFEKFLGTHGTLTQFYQRYLSSFVDTSDNKLQWKKIHNQTLPFSSNVLTNLIQAANLQRLYFPTQNDEVSYKFTLQPLWIDKASKTFHMTLNGQQLEWERGLPRIAQPLTWPGNLANLKTQISLFLNNNEVMHSIMKGDWGWQRLVSASAPHIISDHKTILTFNMSGHKVRYAMFTDGHSNPFIVNERQGLQLQDDL